MDKEGEGLLFLSKSSGPQRCRGVFPEGETISIEGTLEDLVGGSRSAFSLIFVVMGGKER